MNIRDKLLEEYIIAETLKILSGETIIQVSKRDMQLLDYYNYKEEQKVKTLEKTINKGGFNNERKRNIYNKD